MNFILITGPPGVGKMTVGQELCKKLGYRLFHNHHSIELALDLFDYGTPEFNQINEGIRTLVFETVAKSRSLPGFIFTLVWAFDLREDWDYVNNLKALFASQNWTFYIVELYAPLSVRLERNSTSNRLKYKPSKRNLEKSRQGILELEYTYQLNTDGTAIGEAHYLRIDNTHMPAGAAAELIINRFQLPGTGEASFQAILPE